MTRKEMGERAVKDAFGGPLYQQGRGFYVGLEFFAIVRGLLDANSPLFPQDVSVKPEYLRRSHDFARRLVANPTNIETAKRGHLRPGAEETLRELLAGLTVPIPGMRQEPQWWNVHFFPYVGDLIHYDAVRRENRTTKISIERYTYRGGGGLAYRLLWEDTDELRKSSIRTALEDLVQRSAGPLGRLARALNALDSEPRDREADQPFVDTVAGETRVKPTPWIEPFREGVKNLLAHTDLPVARRVDALMHWIPFCMAMHQLSCARIELGLGERAPLVFECVRESTPVRRLAREDFERATAIVYESLAKRAATNGYAELLEGRQSWRDGCRTFFTTTLGTIGAINAMTGTRHFRLGTQVLDAIVRAMVPREMPFERFTHSVLFESLGLVVDGRSAADAGRIGGADRGYFDQNADELEDELEGLGVLRRFSDATRMVGGRLG